MKEEIITYSEEFLSLVGQGDWWKEILQQHFTWWFYVKCSPVNVGVLFKHMYYTLLRGVYTHTNHSIDVCATFLGFFHWCDCKLPFKLQYFSAQITRGIYRNKQKLRKQETIIIIIRKANFSGFVSSFFSLSN